MAFLKQASLKISEPDISVNEWLGKGNNVKTASNKIVDYKKIIDDFNPEKYLLTHCTIVASVDVEEASKPIHFGSEKTKKEFIKLEGRKDYYINPVTSKYMNANGDAWSRDLLKNSYKTFIGAENYVEHVQDPSLSKGKILDAVLREVDGGKSLFVDILVATDKKHKELVDKIKTGQLQTLSMGAVVAFTTCSQCGRVATDETELCSHIKFLKKNSFISEFDGKKRITAELCGHFLYPESNKFIEGSWVETPAFKGAVMRNEIIIGEGEKNAFSEKYSQILNIQSPDLRDSAERIINAFKLVDKVKTSFLKEAQTDVDDEDEEDTVEDQTVEDVPTEEESPDEVSEETQEIVDVPVEEAPVEEVPEDAPVEEAPTEEVPEDAPVEEAPTEEVPEEMLEMGEPPEEVKEEEKTVEVNQPFDLIKEEIKQKLKEDIKKEILKDLGIDIEPKPIPSTSLDNVNLNDSLLRASLNRLKSGCTIAKNQGLKKLASEGYLKEEILVIAKISNKYSINNDIFRIVNDLEVSKYPTFRRIAKEVEVRLGRELEIKERMSLDSLIRDLFF
jgi:hypothetical protein